MRGRFSARVIVPADGTEPDWIVLLLPTAIAIRVFSAEGSLLIIGFFLAAAYIRRFDAKFQLNAGPLVLLFLSCAIVFSRPAGIGPLLNLLLVFALVVRLVTTVDARRIIASLIDGCGLYLFANVCFYAAGLQSPSTDFRLGGLVESTGFVRIVYPLTSSINSPPIIAAVYIASSIFLIRQPGSVRRSFRLMFFVAAIIVLVGSGSRGALASAVALSLLVLCLPVVTRWLVQATTLLAAVSALVLPSIIVSIQFIVTPLMSLAPGRISDARSIATLESREYVWDHSIRYWNDWVNDVPHLLFGYGVNGQYRSGASFSYSEALASLIRHSELAYVHNSFLQQVFDGGVIGWLLFVLATYWAGTRFARRRRDWGVTAIVAMAVLLLGAMTEATMAPGVAQESFWVFLVLVGIACQASGTRAVDGSSERQDATTSQDLKDSASAELKRTLTPVRAGDVRATTRQGRD